MENKLLYTIITIGIVILSYIGIYLTADNSNRKIMIDDTSQVLAHPFVLLVIGAVISSILIPLFTQKSQDRKAKHEIQVKLAKEISKVVTLCIGVAIAITNKKDTVNDQKECVILSKQLEVDLWAYFPTSNLTNEWVTYSNALIGFWALTKNLWDDKYTSDQEYIKLVKKFHQYQNSTKIINWDKLQTKDFRDAYDELHDFLFNEFRIFVVKVYRSEITIF